MIVAAVFVAVTVARRSPGLRVNCYRHPTDAPGHAGYGLFDRPVACRFPLAGHRAFPSLGSLLLVRLPGTKQKCRAT